MSISRMLDIVPLQTMSSHYDERTLNALKAVSKETQAAVQGFNHKKCFFQEHIHLKEYGEDLFPHFHLGHPKRCWEIARKIFADNPLKLEPADFLKEMQLDFFAEAIPSLCKEKEAQKKMCEFQVKMICGSGLQDPNSAIHKAWEAWEIKNLEQLVVSKDYNERMNQLSLIHTELDVKKIITQLHQIANSEEILLKTEMSSPPFVKERISVYFDLLKSMRKTAELADEMQRAKNSYSSLEQQRIKCIDPIKKRELCGSQYQDIDSPIHKAYATYFFKEHEFEALGEGTLKLLNKVQLLHPDGKEFEKISTKMDWLSRFHRTEILKKEINSVDSPFNKEDVPLYSDLLRLIQKQFSLTIESASLYKAYCELETKRKSYEKQKAQTDSEISLLTACQPSFVQNSTWIKDFKTYKYVSFPKNAAKEVGVEEVKANCFRFMYEYRKAVQQELHKALRGSRPLRCWRVVEKAIQAPSDSLFNEIRSLINSFAPDDKTYVWRKLYNRCADNYQELQWSENHFPEFLPELQKILAEVLHKYDF